MRIHFGDRLQLDCHVFTIWAYRKKWYIGRYNPADIKSLPKEMKIGGGGLKQGSRLIAVEHHIQSYCEERGIHYTQNSFMRVPNYSHHLWQGVNSAFIPPDIS